MSAYCSFAPGDPLHQPYHDHEYGFTLGHDNALFERLVLEINQAGLSWATILRKREGFSRAYGGFEIAKVARYSTADQLRLLSDANIIRNKLKVNAAIENAKRIEALQNEHGSFKAWLDAHHPLKLDQWVKLFKKHFKFVGPEICNEFLMSTAYLPGSHKPECPVYPKIVATKPPWYLERRFFGL